MSIEVAAAPVEPGEDTCPPPRPVPGWLAPILERERREGEVRDAARCAQGARQAQAINARLAELGITPLKAAGYVPHCPVNAILLEPYQVDDGEVRVEVGWEGGPDGHVALYTYDPETYSRCLVGPLETVQQAADARLGAPTPGPVPLDHAEQAERQLRPALLRLQQLSGDEDAPLWSVGVAGVHALLALDTTLRRLGTRAALARLAAGPAFAHDAVIDQRAADRLLAAIHAADDDTHDAPQDPSRHAVDDAANTDASQGAAPGERRGALARAHRLAGELLATLPEAMVSVYWLGDTARPRLAVDVLQRATLQQTMDACRAWALRVEADLAHELAVGVGADGRKWHNITARADYKNIDVSINCFHYESAADQAGAAAGAARQAPDDGSWRPHDPGRDA